MQKDDTYLDDEDTTDWKSNNGAKSSGDTSATLAGDPEVKQRAA